MKNETSKNGRTFDHNGQKEKTKVPTQQSESLKSSNKNVNKESCASKTSPSKTKNVAASVKNPTRTAKTYTKIYYNARYRNDNMRQLNSDPKCKKSTAATSSSRDDVHYRSCEHDDAESQPAKNELAIQRPPRSSFSVTNRTEPDRLINDLQKVKNNNENASNPKNNGSVLNEQQSDHFDSPENNNAGKAQPWASFRNLNSRQFWNSNTVKNNRRGGHERGSSGEPASNRLQQQYYYSTGGPYEHLKRSSFEVKPHFNHTSQNIRYNWRNNSNPNNGGNVSGLMYQASETL